MRVHDRPDVDPKSHNFCVACPTRYVTSGTTITYVVPVEPMMAAQPLRNPCWTGIGISFNGPGSD